MAFFTAENDVAGSIPGGGAARLHWKAERKNARVEAHVDERWVGKINPDAGFLTLHTCTGTFKSINQSI